jgi:FKBP-type peptidyl-prolyl cis-trans isomerase 2
MKSVLSSLALLLLALAMIGCAPATVKDKKVVQMNYKGTLADGTSFGQSEPGKPLEFMVGAGKLIPTLEKAVLGLKVGDKKKIQVKAADAYGEYDKSAIQEVPKEQFPKDLTIAIGEHYRVQTPQGPLTVTITAISAKTVTVDFNHPLAGKDLTFDVEIVKIRDATKEELASAFPTQAPQQSPGTPAPQTSK